MNPETVYNRIVEIGVIPAIRLSSTDDALFAAEAVCSSGIPIVEVTMTIPGAIEIIRTVAAKMPEVVVGAGTVMDAEAARRCLDAGARFITTTGLVPGLVEFAREQNAAVFPGVLTPTEVMGALRAGATFVKVYPCGALGGPHYIRSLRGPFPQVRFIAAGGVNQKTISAYFLAGVAAVGIGGDLIHRDAIERRERDWIRELSRRYLGIIKQTREDTLPGD